MEPFHGLLFVHPVGCSNAALLALTVSHTVARAAQHHIEIHAVDAYAGVVLDPQINVLLDAKAKVASSREIVLAQFVLLDLQPLLQYFLRFGPPDCTMNGDLLIPPDAKGAYSKASYKKRNKILDHHLL